MKLTFDIVRTLVEKDTDDDFVAIGNTLSEDKLNHAGFVINYKNELHEFHFVSEIEFCKAYNDYYHKIIELIPKDIVPSFIAYCKNILKNANPKFGYFYSGESYDIDGNHLSNYDLGERMTCVGFCLNVLKGFLETDYINYSDWDNTLNDLQYLADYCQKNKINIDDVKQSHKRITPLECLTSCYFVSLPITKSQIDSRKDSVQEFILQKRKYIATV